MPDNKMKKKNDKLIARKEPYEDPMTPVFVLAILMLFAGLAGYYIGPGFGRYVSWGIAFALLLGIVHRVFMGGREGKGISVRPEV